MKAWVGALALGAMLLGSPAGASPCATAAALVGDPDLVAGVEAFLARAGDRADPTGCGPVTVRIARRGARIVLQREDATGAAVEEREVSEPATAATVIDSWMRRDLERPLLAVHAQVELPPAASPMALAPAVRTDTGVEVAAPAAARRSLQVFAAGEASFADDRTSWLGVVAGLCIQLGAVCASARVRIAAVNRGPGMWGLAERHGEDVLLGGDVPFHLGSSTFSFGFGAGLGAVHTGLKTPTVMAGSQTFGLRADVHLGWTLPIGHGLAVELSTSLDAAQVTDVESSSGDGNPLADEPRVLGRVGVGLRYGAR